MNSKQIDTFRFLSIAAALCLLVAACAWAWNAADGQFANLWLTPDQQGQRMMKRGQFKQAAERFHDSMKKGEALYHDGEFKEAAAAFARVDSPEAKFDRGNSLVMLGKYSDAISSYEAALKTRPDWAEAKANRDLAVARQKKMSPPTDDSEGTEGQEKPDEIVFDDRPKQTSGEHDVEVVAGGEMSDDQIQALWLRRVQTKPADFLRAKFAYQLSRQQSSETEQ